MLNLRRIKTLRMSRNVSEIYVYMHIYMHFYAGHTQKNGAVSKVNKNVFLTLHGHNIHRQRRQLSKFLTKT
jgi:G:T-mismatch repair DNA endonuclease (very short patch repair protein)